MTESSLIQFIADETASVFAPLTPSGLRSDFMNAAASGDFAAVAEELIAVTASRDTALIRKGRAELLVKYAAAFRRPGEAPSEDEKACRLFIAAVERCADPNRRPSGDAVLEALLTSWKDGLYDEERYHERMLDLIGDVRVMASWYDGEEGEKPWKGKTGSKLEEWAETLEFDCEAWEDFQNDFEEYKPLLESAFAERRFLSPRNIGLQKTFVFEAGAIAEFLKAAEDFEWVFYQRDDERDDFY